jgi:hypothetical protein
LSTRSQLRFVQRIEHETDDGEVETRERIAQVYRHSDGYPEAVLPALFRLKRLLDTTRTERGPDYAAAQFVFLEKLRAMSFYIGTNPERSITVREPEAMTDPASFEHLDQPMFLLGHGIENPADGIHGDEEYLYVVAMPRVEFGEVSEWSVTVSEHCGFPRWDGPTDEAFEQATWQYEGPLSGAIELMEPTATP